MTTYATSEQGPFVPAARGLFAEAPRVVPPQRPSERPGAAQVSQVPRGSLFGIVTGALRRGRSSGSVEEDGSMDVASRIDTSATSPESDFAQASVRPSSGDEMGLDIPAFLRRQSS
jgi:cell division protein FtsZ